VGKWGKGKKNGQQASGGKYAHCELGKETPAGKLKGSAAFKERHLPLISEAQEAARSLIISSENQHLTKLFPPPAIHC
jgi:hypothetical protein